MIRITYHEAAEDEVLREVAYLESQAPGLGRRFLQDIRDGEKIVGEFPDSGSQIRPGIRKHTLSKFRYSLVYSVETKEVLILAVAHHRRRPNYWVGRA